MSATQQTVESAAGAMPLSAYSPELSAPEVTLTSAAEEQLAILFADIEDDDIEAIRIYVAGGGCSGMTYGMTFSPERSHYDRVLKAKGFDLYIDAIAMQYLDGVEIDYVTRDTGATFVFNNVFQATGGSGMCTGCGAAGGGQY